LPPCVGPGACTSRGKRREEAREEGGWASECLIVLVGGEGGREGGRKERAYLAEEVVDAGFSWGVVADILQLLTGFLVAGEGGRKGGRERGGSRSD